MFRLHVVLESGDALERSFDDETLSRGLTLGRSEAAGLSLPDRFLSREHARLTLQTGGLMVEDLGSRNGTFVNDVRIEAPTAVRSGDRIAVSGCTITVSTHPESRIAAASPPAFDPAMSVLVPAASLSVMKLDLERTALAGKDLDRYLKRLQMLDDVHRSLARSIALEDLLGMILERLFRHLAPEEGVVILAREDGSYERVAERRAPGVESQALYSKTLIEEVAGRGQAALVLDAQVDGRFAGAQSIMTSGVRSIVAAPLLVEGESLGMLAMSSRVSERQFGESDLELLVSLASVAALRIRNVALGTAAADRRRLEAEIELARNVQESLLTGTIPAVPGYDVFALNRPSQGVSGDLYQVLPTESESRFFVFLFDVSGKGLAASILTATIEALAASLIAADLEPDRICALVSDLLERRTLPDRFATAFLARIDVEDDQLTYANAGHNPALLVHPQGAVERLPRTGLPFAVLSGGEYTSRTVELAPGDLLLIYSDGYTEAMNPDGKEYGLDRLESVCLSGGTANAAEIARLIEESVAEFAAGRPYDDDRTLVVMRRLASGEEPPGGGM